MGNWTHVAISRCFPAALFQLGYDSEDSVIIIAFDDRVERVLVNGANPKVGDLKAGMSNIKCRGGTEMREVPQALISALEEDGGDRYHCWVVSDGIVNDQELTAKKAESLSKEFKHSGLTMSLIRFKTSTYGAPDTRALSCMGLFNSKGSSVALMDVETGKTEMEGTLNLIDALVLGGAQSAIGYEIELKAEKETIRVGWGEVELKSSVMIPCIFSDVPTMIYSEESFGEEIEMGGVKFEVKKDKTVTPYQLSLFLDRIGRELKVKMAAAGKNEWSEELVKEHTDTLAFVEALELSPGCAEVVKEFRTQLLEDRLSMNAQQIADWVNKSCSKQRRDVAKAEEEDKEIEIRNVDLDLSVTLFDQYWAALDTCSFEQLSLRDQCVVHSGDVLRAPYPYGGREAVDIDVHALKKAYPDCCYIVMSVYSFSGCDLNAVDASVFLSDPTAPGSGPEMGKILSAATLKGDGCANVSAFIYFQDDLPYLYFVDQTLDVASRTALEGHIPVSNVCRKIVEEKKSNVGKRLRAVNNASLIASALSTKVSVVHAPKDSKGEETECTVLQRAPNETTFAFYVRVQRAMDEMNVTPMHVLPMSLRSELENGGSIAVVKGSLWGNTRLCQSLPSKQTSKGSSVLIVDVCSETNGKKELAHPSIGVEVEVVQGPKAFNILMNE